MTTEIEFVSDWKNWRKNRRYKISDIGPGVCSELVKRGKAIYGRDEHEQIDSCNATSDRGGNANAGEEAARAKSKRHNAR